MKAKYMKNLKVLIVEDEQKLAKLLQKSIQDMFYKVIIAKDGLEGFKKYQTFKPDLIISDILMPNLDGLEMSKQIRFENSEIPIIILSAHSEKERLLMAIDLHINKYFIKPFDIEEFIEFLKLISKNINKSKSIKLKDDFVFNNNTRNLYKNDTLVNLTKKEREFIEALIENSGEPLEDEKIKNLLWSGEESSDERLRTFIKRLRVKTSKNLIENVSSRGYLIEIL